MAEFLDVAYGVKRWILGFMMDGVLRNQRQHLRVDSVNFLLDAFCELPRLTAMRHGRDYQTAM